MEPSLRAERSLWKNGLFRVAGVDEVGIGSLCGPVLAAAVIVPPFARRLRDVRDSKLLNGQQRERLYAQILRRCIAVGLGAASVSEIEQFNVWHASHLAMRRALAQLRGFDHALIDGRAIPSFASIAHTTLVDGDAQCYSIACASILAKVTRDRLMARLAIRYPGYGWEQNAGYGTPHHLAALRDRGITPFHRKTYAPVRALLSEVDS